MNKSPDETGAKAVIKAVLNHFDAMDMPVACFRLLIPNTTPPIYIIVGSADHCACLLPAED